MSNKESFDELIIQFPLLKSEIIEEDPEMTHMRMERFADYTIKQIESDNNIELKKCFDFQESHIDLMTFDLNNALVVSYCEALLLGKCAAKMNQIIRLMPPKLQLIYTDYEKWYNELAENINQK